MPDQTPNVDNCRKVVSAASKSRAEGKNPLVEVASGDRRACRRGILFLRHKAAARADRTNRSRYIWHGSSRDHSRRAEGRLGVYVNALGTVTPVYTVTVTSRVVGQIDSVNYQEGQIVQRVIPFWRSIHVPIRRR